MTKSSPAASAPPPAPRWQRLWPVALLLAGAVALHISGLTQYLSLDSLRLHHRVMSGWIEQHRLPASGIFVAIYIVAVTFSMPGALVLTLAGGLYFGTLLGATLTVIGATAGATLVFLMARQVFGDRAVDRLGPKAARIAEGMRRDAGSYLLTIRLVPIFPFFLINLVAAAVGMPVATYIAATGVGIIPATVIYAMAGSGLDRILDSNAPLSPRMILSPEIVAGLAGLAVLALASIPIRHWLDRRAGRG